jgi:beta-glucanase (GH16 family)
VKADRVNLEVAEGDCRMIEHFELGLSRPTSRVEASISRLIFKVARSLFVSAFVPIAFCAHAQSTAPPNYSLQWSDKFPGDSLDITKWNYRTDIKAKSAQSPANISVSDGEMSIAVRHQNFHGEQFTGGGIVSKAAFRYGYFEVEAKTTRNPGWHSSFWMLAGSGVTSFAPGALTELDDFEINSSAPDVISMGMLEWSGGKSVGSTRCNAHYKPGWSTAEGFHTYGLEWTEQEIQYYVDGSRICRQPYSPTQHTHDAVNVWLTSIGYLSDIAVTDPSSSVKFRNVAYYIRDYYIANGDPGYVEYGPGWNTSLQPGYSKIPSRITCDENASAAYTPTILKAANYDVQVYRVPAPNGDSAAHVTIDFDGGSKDKMIDFAAGGEGWIDLGAYPFSVGSGGSLTTSTSGKGCIRTSMVKFVRQ